MASENITDYIKEAFEAKDSGDYKVAIDYFYKALAIDCESSEILLELAGLYVLLFQNERAIDLYEQILSKHPDNFAAKYSYASLLKKIKNFDKALTYFQDLLKAKYDVVTVATKIIDIYFYNGQYQNLVDIFSNNALVLKNSSILYKVGFSYKKLGNEILALEYFKQSFDLDNENIDSGIEIIDNYLKQGNYEEAEILAKKLISKSENDRIFSALGDISYSKNDYNSAIKNYSYALKLNDKESSYFYKLALIYSEKGFFGEAEECLCSAVELEPLNTFYFYSLAYLYYLNYKYDMAERVLDTIFLTDDKDINAITLKIVLLLLKDKVTNANEFVSKIDMNSKLDDFTFYALALFYSKKSMYEKAIGFINKALEKNPNSLEYNCELAIYCFNLGKIDFAEKICDEIISKNDKYIPLYLLKMEILLKKNDYENIFSIAKKIINLDKNCVQAYFILGQIYFDRKDFDKALENFKIAISIQPQNQKHYEMIGECYFEFEMYEDAYHYFKEASELDMLNSKNFYMMAKCACAMNKKDSALAHFSVMKRLAPKNIEYIKEYAEFLCSIGNKKAAVDVVNSTIKLFDGDIKKELKDFLKKIK